jgi:hypothetical protein
LWAHVLWRRIAPYFVVTCAVVADRLCLAAAPTFAIMAMLAAAGGDGRHDMVCLAASDASPLRGMALMYALMSAFHSVPWLKLISSRRRGSRQF